MEPYGQHLLEGLPCLLPVGRLRHLWGIDAGHPDRDVLPTIRDPQGVAIADGEHRRGLGSQGGEQREGQGHSLE